MARMSSQEYTTWMALFRIKGDEDTHARHVAESGDGIVHYSGRDTDEDDDEEDDESDGTPE